MRERNGVIWERRKRDPGVGKAEENTAIKS
jgi:hypothetical protein